MIIDVHAHHYPQSYVRTLKRHGAEVPDRAINLPATDLREHLDARLRMMDEAGVAIQVLSTSPHPPYFESEASASEGARVANDTYAELIGRYPTRFRAFASLPLPHLDASMREMVRALDELKMDGINVTTTVLNRSFAESQFEPLYAEMNRRGTILFIHPSGCGLCSPMLNDYNFTWSAGAPLENTMIVLQMLARQIPIRYPNIRIVVCHLGGALPMLMPRLDHQVPTLHPNLAEAPTVTIKRFWYDTVGHGSTAAIRCANEALGADRLVLGSDYPYQLSEGYDDAVTYIKRANISEGDVDMILDRNATSLFKLGDK